jgi:heme O synthase-like polyprenyltransferase
MMAVWTVLLVTASLTFTPLGLAGRVYLGIATALGAGFLALVLRGLRGGSRLDVARAEDPPKAGRRPEGHTQWAKGVFAYSIPYLSILLVALLLDRSR